MLKQIMDEKQLLPFLHKEIEDQGIMVGVEDTLNENDYIGIKVDDYYNSLHLQYPPKSVDFVVVVDCSCNSYVLYILELKNVNSCHHFKIRDIYEKFETTINDFLKTKYKHIFLNDKYKYKDIKLYLVSDAYGAAGKFKNHEEYKKVNKRDSLKVDLNLSSKIFKIRNKYLKILYDIPPNPIIKKIV